MTYQPFARFASLPLIAGLLLLMAPTAFARSAPDSFADLAEKLLPAVVNIATTQKITDANRGDLEEMFKQFFDRRKGQNGGNGENGGGGSGGGDGGSGDNGPGGATPHEVTSLGSGFIIDPAGYIVTNNHVIDAAEEITVRMQDNTEYKAKLIGHDSKTDLALLKIETPTRLPYVEWGDSDKSRIGDWVLAIGNPFGLGGTVTAGILSARQRDINAGPYDDFLQTDAAINRGNSGGPMFDVDGKVIGINTAIFSPSGGSIGIGFALPASLAKPVINQLRQFGHARRGWLGVRIQSVTPELAEGLKMPKPVGALVAAATGGGPADKAGIKQGDVIIRFNGQDISEMRHLPRIVAETPFDASVPVVVLRQGKELNFKVKLGELDEAAEARPSAGSEQPAPAPKPAQKAKTVLGLSLAEMSEALRQKYSIADEASGVVVLDVDTKSNAATKGLKPGDVIVEVDQTAVSSPVDVQKRVAAAKANGYKVVTLLVYRQGDFQWVAVRADQG
ncbi:MAG: serine protease Do [Rhodospirillaceae bacterium]|nr:serine protease Do [Rhodospirillaceae bacterium]